MDLKPDKKQVAKTADGPGSGSAAPEATDGRTSSIAAVERDTGLPKDTLRVWERRYGFPNPARDEFGERAYSTEQVDKLRILRRLIDAGHRPGRIIALPVEQLRELAESSGATASTASDPEQMPEELRHYLDLVRRHQVDELRNALAQAVLRQGVERFVAEICAPLTRAVGEAWSRGALEIFEEHLYTESMQVVLRNAIAGLQAADAGPRVLLTTFPNEQHGLGLLMAEAFLAVEGCRCISLGTQTPVIDIVQAARTQRADIVALSFSAMLGAKQVVDGLLELRRELPPQTRLWAGGRAPVLKRKPPPGVVVLTDLGQIRMELAAWRAREAPG